MECPKDLVYCYFVNEWIYLFMYIMHTIWYLYCMYVLNMYHNACIKCFIIQSIVMILKVRSLFTGWSVRNHTLWTGKDEGKCSYVGIGKKFIILNLKFLYQYLHEGKIMELIYQQDNFPIIYWNGLFQFEKTADHLFEAAYHGQRDTINGRPIRCTKYFLLKDACVYLNDCSMYI